MNDVLSEKKSATDVLIARAEKIHEEFQFILGTSRLDVTLKFETILNEIRESAMELAKYNDSVDPWKLASQIGTIDNGFAQLAEIVLNFNPDEVKTGASHTYLLATRGDMDSFLQYHRLFAENDINNRAYSLLSQKIESESPETAESKYLAHPHSSILFARYLQVALDDSGKTDKLPYIMVLERAKTRAIVGADVEKKTQKTSVTWPLQRFGLVPVKQHMQPEELVKYYFENAISGGAITRSVISGGAKPKIVKQESLDVFIAAARLKKINVLVLMAITSSPIEYNVSTLMEPTPGVDASHGVSPMVLKKFNTVHKHIKYDADDRAIPPKHIGFSATEHNLAPMSRRYAIIRTIDGAHYDAMKTTEMSDNFADASLVEKLLRDPSPRVDAYQAIKAAEFEKFVMSAPEMGESVKKANKGVIQDLVNRITGRIIQYVDSSLVPLPEDPAGLEAAISDPRFVEIMTEEFLKSYSSSGIDTTRPGAAPPDELVGTFIADFETNIAIQFARNIKLNMIELGPSATVFRDYHGETLRTRLYNLFVDVIKRSITGSIMTKENIYEKILIKDHLLGVLAHQLSKAEDK